MKVKRLHRGGIVDEYLEADRGFAFASECRGLSSSTFLVIPLALGHSGAPGRTDVQQLEVRLFSKAKCTLLLAPGILVQPDTTTVLLCLQGLKIKAQINLVETCRLSRYCTAQHTLLFEASFLKNPIFLFQNYKCMYDLHHK